MLLIFFKCIFFLCHDIQMQQFKTKERLCKCCNFTDENYGEIDHTFCILLFCFLSEFHRQFRMLNVVCVHGFQLFSNWLWSIREEMFFLFTYFTLTTMISMHIKKSRLQTFSYNGLSLEKHVLLKFLILAKFVDIELASL